MTEPDILSRKINELKRWQTLAWQRIADPLMTAFERREMRNHIRESTAFFTDFSFSPNRRNSFTTT